MKNYTTILLLAFLAALSNPAMAHYDHDGYSKFDQRIERQHKRIKQGARNGELTQKEVKKLRKQHRHIKKLNQQFKQDGHLSRREQKTLRQALDLASKRIYRLKHNDHYRNTDLHRHGHDKKKHHGHSYGYRDNDHDRSVVLGYRDQD